MLSRRSKKALRRSLRELKGHDAAVGTLAILVTIIIFFVQDCSNKWERNENLAALYETTGQLSEILEGVTVGQRVLLWETGRLIDTTRKLVDEMRNNVRQTSGIDCVNKRLCDLVKLNCRMIRQNSEMITNLGIQIHMLDGLLQLEGLQNSLLFDVLETLKQAESRNRELSDSADVILGLLRSIESDSIIVAGSGTSGSPPCNYMLLFLENQYDDVLRPLFLQPFDGFGLNRRTIMPSFDGPGPLNIAEGRQEFRVRPALCGESGLGWTLRITVPEDLAGSATMATEFARHGTDDSIGKRLDLNGNDEYYLTDLVDREIVISIDTDMAFDSERNQSFCRYDTLAPANASAGKLIIASFALHYRLSRDGGDPSIEGRLLFPRFINQEMPGEDASSLELTEFGSMLNSAFRTYLP